MQATDTFTYPPEFVERVKAEFPDYQNMHAMFDEGHEDAFFEVASECDPAASGETITPEEVVAAFNGSEMMRRELRSKAERIIRRRGLLDEFETMLRHP